ncbi:uncharacterized protein LTR77_010833 [Saxophila tyrrhenica]|uniref:Asl1-like glycosyl hydrolase catalytic domain-containing protein n=1 Tax=Saxophila tyrrhenica TaxID=1690608 RepID=A0AAV9NUB3_9PEZI|nr:hypothetical protein LTR77_010833 [Saxophila tyrrhenica]
MSRVSRFLSTTMLTIPSFLTALLAATALAYPQPAVEERATGLTRKHLTPKGRKAGLSGYIGIQSTPAFAQLAPHLSWYSDYTPNTPPSHGLKGVGMLWGASGSSCGSTSDDRLATFKHMINKGNIPDTMFGFYEPDCSCPSSSDMTVAEGASDWNALLSPLDKKHGTILGSPSMCKQYDEDYLTPFKSRISRPWDVTAIHVNKPNLAEAKKDVEYYVQKYKKPVWVAEFACVHDQPSWEPCTDQGEIDRFIKDVVKYFEGNKHVVAYGPSNGEGLGEVWPLTREGKLTASGRTYLEAVKRV